MDVPLVGCITLRVMQQELAKGRNRRVRPARTLRLLARCVRNAPCLLAAMVLALTQAAASRGEAPAHAKTGDWLMWGGAPDRNMVSDEKGIPTAWDIDTKKNIKWVAPLGSYTYGTPVVANHRVFVGTNNAGNYRPEIKGDKGVVVCLDEQTGKFLWQATHDKLASGNINDWAEQGICSAPWVDGDRLYYVSNRCELVCADVNGFLDGNDGPYKEEKYHAKQDADIIWILDMFTDLKVFPHNLATCSPVGFGDILFVSTSNGVDDSHVKLPAPGAPDLIAVDKRTGKVLWQASDPGDKVLHGQWSSPAYGVMGGQPQVVFAGGDGWCYSYAPTNGKLLWKFDLNPKDAKWEAAGRGTRNSIIATPVIHDDKVFLASGHDPEHGDGPGHLYAIDGTKRGDITESGRVWHVGGDDFHRTLSTVAVADGLLYAVDLSGFLYCLDAKTGQRHWRYDTFAGVWGSPFVADGKVFLGDEDGEVAVLQHGTTMKELATNDMQASIYTAPVVSNGVLYITTRSALFAIEAPREPKPTGATRAAGFSLREVTDSSVAPRIRADRPISSAMWASTPQPQATKASWPMFRGGPQLSGVAVSSLPEKLAVRWKFEAPDAVSSSAAIVDGVAFVGCEDDYFYALDMETGAVRWKYKASGPVLSSPLVLEQTVYFGDDDGKLHALDVSSGQAKWVFSSESPIFSSPNHAQGLIVFGSYDGAVYGVKVGDGQLAWKYQTEADRVHGAPCIAGDKVFVGGCDQYLHVIAVSDGKSIRKLPIGSVTGASPAVSGSVVYIPTYGQQVRGIDFKTGTTLWTYEDPDRQFPYLASPAVTSDAIIVAGRDKRVRSLDSATGRLNWAFVAKGRVDSSPVLVGKRVLVGSSDGHLYALDVSSGEETWRFEAGAPITASPAVADGSLVIGTLDGVVYCFGSPAGSTGF